MIKKLPDLKFDSINSTEIDITSEDIAVIGIGMKLPDTENVDQFWDNLQEKKSLIRPFPLKRRKDISSYFESIYGQETKVEYETSGFLEEIDKFDYQFFNLSPKEAELIDPNQRIFLETVWKTIENAGYGGDALKGSNTGVFLGFNSNGIHLYSDLIGKFDRDSIPLAVTGNINPVITGRISYLMDFKGPNMLIDSACSSSLVAVHLACNALRNEECELAIAGGVKINLLPIKGEVEIGIESASNQTRTFDMNADGTVWGEGSAAILLKPYYKAVKDGDDIYGVIKASMINQDGASIGITAPNRKAQEELLLKSWRKAKINPEKISYIEVHGTGTKLGDPIEIDAITRAFRSFTNKNQFCGVGSIKTNYGHLDSCAGIIGLIKTLLIVKNKKIMPMLNFKIPNLEIDFVNSPVYVCDREHSLEETSDIYCGVSAFGLSGTNCHVLLGEAPKEVSRPVMNRGYYGIFTLSAKSIFSLEQMIDAYIHYLEKGRVADFRDLCYTTNIGRGHYLYRLAIIADSNQMLLDKLKTLKACGYSWEEGKEDIYLNCHKIKREEFCQEQITETDYEILKLIQHSLQDTDIMKQQALRKLCELYIDGADILWKELYIEQNRRRIHLPEYIFERTRCWINMPSVSNFHLIEEFCYDLTWQKEEQRKHFKSKGTTLLFMDKGIEYITEILKQMGSNIIKVYFSKGLERISEDEYNIGYDELEYIKLFESIDVLGLSKIIFIHSSLKQSEDLNRKISALLNLVKALLKNITLSQKIELFVVGETINEITTRETQILPEGAAFFGMSKVIPVEYSNISVKCIDIDNLLSPERLAEEFFTEKPFDIVAYRENLRYTQLLKPLGTNKINQNEKKIQSEGVYVITGGLGGLGLEVAHYLSVNEKVNIVLISRNKFPARDKWEEFCKSKGNEDVKTKIRQIKSIEDNGAKVSIYSCDVTDSNAMSKVAKEINTELGAINGIIHCAGVIGDKFLIRETVESFNNVIAPKIFGLKNIETFMCSDRLEFLVLFSSVNSLYGMPGQGAYTAGNTYLDAYVSYAHRRGIPAITINWSPWKETGMFHRSKEKDFKIFQPLLIKEALQTFDYIMKSDISKVIVGKVKSQFADELRQLALPFSLAEDFKVNSKEKDRKMEAEKEHSTDLDIKTLELNGRDDGMYSTHEKSIAVIWKKILGFKNININSNFFDIGGNSIALMKVYDLLDEDIKKIVTLADLFSYPTIAKLALLIEEKSNSEKIDTEDSLDRMFKEMENGTLTSEDIAEQLLAWRNEHV